MSDHETTTQIYDIIESVAYAKSTDTDLAFKLGQARMFLHAALENKDAAVSMASEAKDNLLQAREQLFTVVALIDAATKKIDELK
jgi:hypothetical protein